MSDYISRWHKELSIFSKIKPLIILEGTILDSYQYSSFAGVFAFLFQGHGLSKYYFL